MVDFDVLLFLACIFGMLWFSEARISFRGSTHDFEGICVFSRCESDKTNREMDETDTAGEDFVHFVLCEENLWKEYSKRHCLVYH